MIKIVFYNKNALYYFGHQDQHNAMYNLWPKRLLLFHATVLLFAQLHCTVKLKYSEVVSLYIHNFISLK